MCIVLQGLIQKESMLHILKCSQAQDQRLLHRPRHRMRPGPLHAIHEKKIIVTFSNCSWSHSSMLSSLPPVSRLQVILDAEQTAASFEEVLCQHAAYCARMLGRGKS